MNEPNALTYINCDRTAEILREHMRRYRDSYVESEHELPQAEMLASSMMVALRDNVTNAGAIAAMYLGLKQMAVEILSEVRH